MTFKKSEKIMGVSITIRHNISSVMGASSNILHLRHPVDASYRILYSDPIVPCGSESKRAVNQFKLPAVKTFFDGFF